MSKRDIEESKRRAAEKALDYVVDGMTVGLGTGSTAEYFIRKLAEKGADVLGVPTSRRTERLARNLDICLTPLEGHGSLDIYVDGADEADPEFNLIKGGGGAHTSEKRAAEKAKKFIVIVDYRKMVERLGKFPVPVEVEESKKESVKRQLKALGGIPKTREDFITDRGNIIIDSKFDIQDPLRLEKQLNSIQGVVENGIFSKRKPEIIIIGKADGVTEIKRG